MPYALKPGKTSQNPPSFVDLTTPSRDILNNRVLEQLLEVFAALCHQAQGVLPKEDAELGDLTLIDGSLIDATLSMQWAD